MGAPGRKAVVAFTVEDEVSEEFIHAVSYAGVDWNGRRRGVFRNDFLYTASVVSFDSRSQKFSKFQI